MVTQADPREREGFRYARSILRDRQRDLRHLELKHRQKSILGDDYLSSRRSLLQAISQLEALLRRDPDNERRGPTEPSPGD